MGHTPNYIPILCVSYMCVRMNEGPLCIVLWFAASVLLDIVMGTAIIDTSP